MWKASWLDTVPGSGSPRGTFTHSGCSLASPGDRRCPCSSGLSTSQSPAAPDRTSWRNRVGPVQPDGKSPECTGTCAWKCPGGLGGGDWPRSPGGPQFQGCMVWTASSPGTEAAWGSGSVPEKGRCWSQSVRGRKAVPCGPAARSLGPSSSMSRDRDTPSRLAASSALVPAALPLVKSLPLLPAWGSTPPPPAATAWKWELEAGGAAPGHW